MISANHSTEAAIRTTLMIAVSGCLVVSVNLIYNLLRKYVVFSPATQQGIFLCLLDILSV